MGARLLGSVADGEDAAQETYVRAYRSLVAGKFDGRSRVETWLYRILTNVAIDMLRARARKPTSAQDQDGFEAVGGERQAVARVALGELDGWLAALPADQRVALTLSVVEGMANGDIAEIMECSEGAVEQRLVRARASLRQREGVGDHE